MRSQATGQPSGEVRIETDRKQYPVRSRITLHVPDRDGPVSGVTVIHHRMRIGRADVPMGGIGGVWTDRDHRRKGYSRQCMEFSTRWMREAGLEIALLFGIRDFYPKFGYAVAMAHSQLELVTRTAELARGSGRVRRMRDADRAAVLKLYERENAARTGSILRDRRRWRGFTKGWGWGRPAPETVVCVREGKVAGYAVCSLAEDAVRVAEVGATEAGAYEALIRHFARLAAARRCERFQVYCPPDHRFRDAAGRFNAHLTAHFPRDGEAMMRVLDVVKLLRRCAGELAERLDRGGAAAAKWRGTVEIATDEGTAFLARSKRAVQVSDRRPAGRIGGRIALRQDVLAQLLVGYRDVDDAATRGELQLAGAGQTVAKALFPRGWPFLWRPDHF